ncbi:MAG TPA: hypothetical protein VJX67_26600 [Blastocatellia bacterium]|nr:hypothetical protein [Blastocatellia bacterium]
MLKRCLLMMLPLLLLTLSVEVKAQGYYQFLGDPTPVPDSTSQRNGIRYNTQGFDTPHTHQVKKMIKKGAPDSAVQAVLDFPGNTTAFSNWIDDAYEQTQKEFTDCGGSLASRARQVSAGAVYVIVEPTAFYVPELGYAVAGAYYPDTNQIRVLNIYYIWSGPNKGWLRESKDLLKWEMENYFAVQVGVQAEPRTPNWPCDAPTTR